MENSPHNADLSLDTGSSEKKESKSKNKDKNKKAGAIGAVAVEPKSAKEKSFKDSIFEFDAEPEAATNVDRMNKSEKLYTEREFTKAEQAADDNPDPAVERFRNRIIIERLDSDAALTETIAEVADLPDADDKFAEILLGDAPSRQKQEADTDTDAEAFSVGDHSPHEFGEEVVILNERGESDTDTEADGRGQPPRGPGRVGTAILFGGIPGGPSGPGFNAAPAAGTRTVEYRGGNTAGAALVGGIVGYLIGRRRGRIKTEKRLIPVQKKLQKEVVSLQSQLQQKEFKIRTLAATKVQESLKPVTEKVKAPDVINYIDRVVAKVPERSVIRRTPAAEANQLHRKRHAPEQIGHVLVGVESSQKAYPVSEVLAKAKVLEKLAKPEKIDKQAPALSVEKNIDTLNRVDLLKLSEKIIVDGSSLRQIYEGRLIGEKGLRRLVKEHLGGGDIKKALRREIVEREIDFERDPGLRDQKPQSATLKGGGRAATLDDLLQNAELTVGEDPEEAAFVKARSAHEEQQREQQKNHQRMLDVSLAGTILILIGLIVMLIMNH